MSGFLLQCSIIGTICHIAIINAICFGLPSFRKTRLPLGDEGNVLHLFAAHIAFILSSTDIRALFAGLHQRAVPARALQKLEKAEYAAGKKHDVEQECIDHQVGPKNVLDQKRAHALENICRG